MDIGNGDKCWVALVYDWGDKGLSIARTSDSSILHLIKQKILSEAKSRLSISKDIDEVMAVLDEAELKRLQTVLDMLIPSETEELVLPQGDKGTEGDD